MISKQFAKRRKDSAVSPVIATILMVAITVVLAAVLYVMVGGFTHNPGTAQSAGMNEASVNSTAWNISITSVSASNIPLSDLKIVVTASSGTTSALLATWSTHQPITGSTPLAATGSAYGYITGNSNTYLSAGDYINLNFVSANAGSGATVTLYSGNSQLGTITL